jgi:hypothetical protein
MAPRENESMNTANVLSQSDYEALVKLGLRAKGIDDATIAALLAARWPMTAIDVLSECAARGRYLILEDVADWIRDRFGEAVPLNELGFGPLQVNEILEWAVANDRGRVTFSGFIATDHAPLVESLRDKERSPWN